MPGRYVAVADLHGHLTLLERLLAALDASLGRDYVLVTLGDYADNGPEVPALLDRLVALREERQERFVPIAGNHDLACARVLGWQGAPPDESWYARCARNYWNGMQGTGPAYDARSARELAERMPRAHQEFLQGLPWCFETDEYVFVHAGLRDAPLRPQIDQLARRQLPADPPRSPELLIDRKLSVVSARQWGKTVVSGHTKWPGERVVRHRHCPHYADPWRITLSAEVDAGGTLFAVVLPERRVFAARRNEPAGAESTLD